MQHFTYKKLIKCIAKWLKEERKHSSMDIKDSLSNKENTASSADTGCTMVSFSTLLCVTALKSQKNFKQAIKYSQVDRRKLTHFIRSRNGHIFTF